MSKKTKDKYQAIIDAAVKVIAKYGYHNAQVAKIAREAGVAEGTIYLYFQNKEDVLVSIFKEKMGEYIALVRDELQKTAGPLEKLKLLIQMHFTKLEANRDLAAVLAENGKLYEFYAYAGGGHDITSPYFEEAILRTIAFYQKHL